MSDRRPPFITRDIRAKRIKDGVCTICPTSTPRPARPKRRSCAECATQASTRNAKRWKETRAERRAAGVCTACRRKPPRPACPGKKTCEVCAAKKAAREKARRGKLVRCGLCECGARRRRWRKTCADCGSVMVIKGALADAELMAQGICTRCRKNPARVRPVRKTAPCGVPGPRAEAFARERMRECDDCTRRRTERRKERQDELIAKAARKKARLAKVARALAA